VFGVQIVQGQLPDAVDGAVIVTVVEAELPLRAAVTVTD
jgi:hypothetical protein